MSLRDIDGFSVMPVENELTGEINEVYG